MDMGESIMSDMTAAAAAAKDNQKVGLKWEGERAASWETKHDIFPKQTQKFQHSF